MNDLLANNLLGRGVEGEKRRVINVLPWNNLLFLIRRCGHVQFQLTTLFLKIIFVFKIMLIVN